MNYLQQGDNKWYFATFTSFVWSLLHVILFTISFHEESTRRYHSRALWGSMIGCILSIYSIVKVRASFIVTVAKMSVARRFDDGELHATANGPRVCELLGILLYLLNGASYALWVNGYNTTGVLILIPAVELLPIAILSVLSISTFAANVAPNLRDTPLGNM